MRKIFVLSYFLLVFIGFCFVIYKIGEYTYLKVNFEKVDKEVKEYQDIPYLNRRLSMLEGEYKRVKDIEREIRTPALVLGRIVNSFSRHNVKVNYIVKEVSEDIGEIYKTSVKGNFKDVFFSLIEIENIFAPIRFSRIYMSGTSENVNMVIYFSIVE